MSLYLLIRYFLPVANEVWDKVMFSHLSVILITRGGGHDDTYCVIPCSLGVVCLKEEGDLCLESLSGRSLSRGLCPGVFVQGDLCPGGVCLEVLCQGGLCPGDSLSRGSLSRWGLFPGKSLSRRLLFRGSLSRGSLSREVSVQGGLCPGRFLFRGSLSRGVSVQGGLCSGVLPSVLRSRDIHSTGMLSCFP